MKKLALILLVVCAVGILASSCNRKSCPAYSQHPQEQTDHQRS